MTHEEVQSYLKFVNEEEIKPLKFTFERENLNKLCDEMPTPGISELEEMTSDLMQKLAFAQGYLMSRGAAGCGDSGHEEAMKEGQKHLKKVRKAMGFTAP
jgi:hypothetical protein